MYIEENLPIDKMHTTSLYVHDRMEFSVKYYLQIHNTCISGRAHVDIYVLCMISKMSRVRNELVYKKLHISM